MKFETGGNFEENKVESLEDFDLHQLIGGKALELIEAHEPDRSKEVFRLQRDPDTYEVTVESNVTLEHYKEITRPEDWELLESLAESMKGKTFSFINPTMAGGGVAMMRPPLVHLARLLEVDAHWFVMEGKLKAAETNDALHKTPFIFTKWLHNIIQRRTDRSISDDPKGIATHFVWSGENAKVLVQQNAIKNSHVTIIDDPQPAPLIPELKNTNPNAKILWRNHIDNDASLMEDKNTPQGEVMKYLWESGLKYADAYIFHPDAHDGFIPARMREKAYLAPATIEPHDDMNRLLTDEEIAEGLAAINNEIDEENQMLKQVGRYDDVQDFIDPERDRFVLIARFDESKGMDKMLELGARIRQEVLDKRPDGRPPQIIIIGNGSVDDPSGEMMLGAVRQMRREFPEEVRKDIIVKRLKHNYMAINATMYNKSENAVLVAAQMSDAEGCETRITDWIAHGIPVVVANRGGMPLQITEGKSGTVLDYDTPDKDFERGAKFVSNLIINHEAYQAMRESTLEASHEYNEREYTTVANMIRWLRIMNRVLDGQTPDKLWKLSDIQENTKHM